VIGDDGIEAWPAAPGQDHGTLDHVLQLPDVARPVVALELLPLLHRYPWLGDAELARREGGEVRS